MKSLEYTTYIFALGYHDGRMDYNKDTTIEKEYMEMYLKGYELGVEERSEQDER